MKQTIYEEYGIKVREISKLGHYDSFSLHNNQFIIVPVSHIEEEELYELYQLSQYMLEKGEPHIATMVLTKQNHLFFEQDSVRYAVLKCSAYTQGRFNLLGRDLARFHSKARAYPYQVSKTQRIGQWKILWEKRLDQLEMFWRGKVQSQPLSTFEKLFVESFPYYVGLSENAIQYLVDTELDEEPQPIDSGTICHQRFHEYTWNPSMCIKSPTDWVFDHSSRDLAEYMRQYFLEKPEQFRSEGFKFLEEYDRTTPLSPFSWRLIYSRLLFPIHYFECVEEYYLSPEDQKPRFEERMKEILNRSGQYEEFLKAYSSMLTIRTRRITVPAIDWLAIR
ncbi:spore coat protein YutH [Metabacillus litoralis]|uniref:spore coat putative kinase YutH n=1 Tax=Metabacillus litoralis TaxID=152268 RepID=UPI001B923CE8|nr:spore coat protein YutH [Metabacillus litoralis]UHA61938.1 spore coat protein YutH [Metabacillus litoralis]